MLGKAVLRHGDNRGGIDGVILCFVERHSLRRTIYIHTFEVAVALDNALAGGIVGVSAGLAVVRQYHQAVVLVPIHAPLRVQAVVLHQRGIPVGIVGIMVMPDLRGRRRVIAVLIQISKCIRLRHLARIHLLFLGERLAHDAVGHIEPVRCRLGLAVGRNQSVDIVVDIAVAVCPAELRLVLLGDVLRVGGVGDTKDIIN